MMLGEIDWNTWYYTVGWDPSGTLNFTTTNSAAAVALAQEYVTLAGDSSPTNYYMYNYWYSNLRVVFQNTL